MLEKFEYKTVSAECGEAWDALVELELKRLGEEGWEVFHVTERRTSLVATVHLKAYLKRRAIPVDFVVIKGVEVTGDPLRDAMQSSIAAQIEGGGYPRVD